MADAVRLDGHQYSLDPVQRFEELDTAFEFIRKVDTAGYAWSAFWPNEADDGFVIVKVGRNVHG